jgi:hypothetical protein
MRINKDFVLREICGENVVVCEGFGAINHKGRKGMMLALNGTAAWLWKEAQAQGDFTVESLTERLCEEYDVTAEEAKSCVTELIEQLVEEGVIEAQ